MPACLPICLPIRANIYRTLPRRFLFLILSVCLFVCVCVCVCLKTAVWCLFAVGLLVVVRLLPVGNVCAPSVTQSDRSLSVYNDGCTKSTRVRLENSESPFGNDISDANGTLDANEEREASSACLCAWGLCTMSVLFFFLSEAQFWSFLFFRCSSALLLLLLPCLPLCHRCCSWPI